MASFGRNLRNMRLNKGLTQEQLAKKLGVSKSRISMYENGNREPSFEMLETIADFFNLDMNALVGSDEPSSSAPVQEQLSDDEQKLLDAYRQLDPEDRAEVRGVAKGLLMADKYKGAELLGGKAI